MVSMKASLAFLWLLLASNRFCVQSFRPDWSNHQTRLSGSCVFSAKNIDRPNTTDNKAMAFLRRMGRVGGNRDFTHAIGIDEGPSTKSTGSGKKVSAMDKQRRRVPDLVDSDPISILRWVAPLSLPAAEKESRLSVLCTYRCH
jgi:hypothetical protein